jgi:hypothetical protein
VARRQVASISSNTTILITAIPMRNKPEIDVPITPPSAWNAGNFSLTKAAESAINALSRTTTVECPSEKKKPTATGRFPLCINLRVVLSMAAMWSGSTACRRPKPYAVNPRPSKSGYFHDAIRTAIQLPTFKTARIA